MTAFYFHNLKPLKVMFGKINTVDNIVKRSLNVVNVFTKTINDLTAINQEITMIADEKEQAIAQLQNDVATLDHQRSENTKVIEKIQNIFS